MKISNGIQLYDNVDDDKNTSDNNIKLKTAPDDDLGVKKKFENHDDSIMDPKI